MVAVKVKWGKNEYALDLDESITLLKLKHQLYTLTHVPVEKQKIMGLKSASSDNGATLSQLGVTAGKMLMLIGPAEGTTIPNVGIAAVEGATRDGHLESCETLSSLNNIANTCYLNAAIQMLCSIPELAKCLSQYSGDNNLLKELGTLLTMMGKAKDPISPLGVWGTLVALNPVFGERDEHGMFMQQDAQEVLSYLLEQIQPVLPPSSTNLFRGELRQKLICAEDSEDAGKTTHVPFTILSCNISGEAQMLEAGLEQAFNEQLNAYNERLQKEASYTKVSRINRLPEYLIVHMVRFSWKNDVHKRAKILKPITFPLILDLFTLLTEDLKEEQKASREMTMLLRDKEQEQRKPGRGDRVAMDQRVEESTYAVPEVLQNTSGLYELCGVISHKGRSAESGHYIYWGKRKKQWFVFDDNHVAAVDEEDVMRLRGVGEAHIAYVLLYRSRDPVTHRPVIPL